MKSIKLVYVKGSFFVQWSMVGETPSLAPVSTKEAFQLAVRYGQSWAHFLPLVELANGLTRVDQRWF